MRIAITVAMVLALAACSRPGGQFLAGDGGSATTRSEDLVAAGLISEGSATQQESAVTATTVGAQATPTTEIETSPVTATTTTVVPASPVTTTATLAVLTVDPQEVEGALAELDALLSSLGSAMSAMEQAFEQGE